MNNYWWIFSLLTSLMVAVYFLANQIFKMNGLLMMVYRGFLVALIVLPFVIFRTPIKEPLFYLYCSLQGLAIAFNDNRFLRASKAFGAEVTSTIQPISVGIIFIMWLIFKPYTIALYAENPIKSMGIVACLVGITYAIIKIKNSKASKIAFLYLLPVLFLLSVGDILNKQSMFHGRENLTTAIFYYAFITGIICGACNLFVYIRKKQKISTIFKKKNLKKGLAVSVIAVILMAFKNLAMFSASNPAYASAIILMSPIWIILWNNFNAYIKGKKSGYAKVNIKLISLLLLCVISLVLLNN